MLPLEPFKEFIATSCGLRFDSGSEQEKLTTALNERMRQSCVSDHGSYLNRIHTDQDEFQALVNLLTINETYFFRESDQLKLLAERIVPRLLVRHNGLAPVRILSAGCSSGEEPYSLVMSLWERYGESLPRLCSVTGVDIDSNVLAKARRGQYGSFSFRGVPETLKQRYFDKAGDVWQLKEEIRSSVNFQELNLLAPAPSEELRDFDIVFFRNVSIYFDEPTRRQIQQNLAGLMKEDGILMIGCSETIANDLGVLGVVEENGLFYFIKGNPPLPEATSPLPATARLSGSPSGTPAETPTIPAAEQELPVLTVPAHWQTSRKPELAIDDLRLLVQEKRYDEALPQLERQLAHLPNDPETLLLKAVILMDRKQFQAARAAAHQVLEQRSWDIDACMLLGLIAKWDHQQTEAISRFKQAVYACHGCWPARYHLADLYSRCGETDLARREYRTLIQFLDKPATETGITLTALKLSATEVRLVSERNLVKLNSQTTG